MELLVPPGEVPGTLRELLEPNAVDVAVDEAGLDEAFLDFYRGADRQEPPTRQEPPGDRPYGRGFALRQGWTDGVAQRVWGHGRLLSVWTD
ncbi:hypothetical protein [Streptomyces sp. NPDC055140]